MNRRKAIKLTGVSIALLSGCASTSTSTPDAMAPLGLVTMLPVENADYHVLDDRDIETNKAISNDASDKKLSDIVVDRGAVDQFHAEMTALQVNVYKKFNQALVARLGRDGVSIAPYSTADQAIAVRANGDIATLGKGTDGVIDIRIESLGYRPMASAFVLTPEVRVTLKFVRVADSAILADTQFSFDWRESPANTRHFPCEKSDLYNSVEKLMANLPRAAATLDRGTMLMVDRVADDIVQVYGGNSLS